jgi:hypothetical protein
MWYTANLLFKSVHAASSQEDTLWEESIRLIKAETKDQAMEKAQALGRASPLTFSVQTGDKVTWVFVKVERIFEIDEESLKDGTEIFSRFLRDSEVQSLLTPFDDQ